MGWVKHIIWSLMFLITLVGAFAVDYTEEQTGYTAGTSGASTYSNINFADCVKFQSNNTYNICGFAYKFNTCTDESYFNMTLWNTTSNTLPDTLLHIFGSEINSCNDVYLNYTSLNCYEIDNGNYYFLCTALESGTTGIQSRGFTSTGTNSYAYTSTYDSWSGPLQIGVGFYTYSGEILNIIDIILKDYINNIFDAIIDESDEFFIMANYSSDGVSIDDASCNFYANNITSHFSINSNNLTVTDNFINLTLEEDVSDYDIVNFRVCNDYNKDIQVLVNDNNYLNISNSIIPHCSIGFHEVNNITTLFSAVTIINLSLTCNDCLGQQNFKLVSNDEGDILHYERFYESHTEDMLYNSTSELYEFKDHLYEFINPAVNIPINVTCDNDSIIEYFNVSNINLTINILSIDNMSYLDGIVVESSNNTIIIIDVSGDIIDSISLNVSYNGSLIKSSDVESIIMNQSELYTLGLYNITVYAVDDEGTGTLKNGYFYINDTINPTIIFNDPSSNDTEKVINESFNLDVDIYDTNLYAYEYYIKNALGVIKFNGSLIDINSTSFNILDSITPDSLGVWIINVTVYDDHTINNIDDYIIEKDDYKINFVVPNSKRALKNVSITYTGIYDVTKSDTIKEDDKYLFSYDVSLESDILKKEVTHKFKVECEDIIFRPDSSYKAHFVCYKTKNWIDFNSDDVIKYYANRIDGDSYEVTLIMRPDSRLLFNSIGGLNVVSEEREFIVVDEKSSGVGKFDSFEVDSIEKAIVLFIIAFLYIGVMMIGFLFNNKGFISLGFFIGIILGFMLFGLGIFLTLIFWFINIIIVLMGVRNP